MSKTTTPCHLTLSAEFSAAHFYARREWSAAKNKEKFGKCFSKHGHGHDYRLEVTFTLPAEDMDARNLAQLTSLLHKLSEKLDHRHLNQEITQFKKTVPTTENIALYCRDHLLRQLQKSNSKVKLQQIRLFEKPDLFVEINRFNDG